MPAPMNMNKPVKLLLILSIAVNAIWLVGAASGWFSFGKTKTSGDVAQAQASGSGALSPLAAREVKALLSTNDAAMLRDKLRSLGLPDDVVREIVTARIMSRYTARSREITGAARQAALHRQYWRGNPLLTMDPYTNEQRTELSDMQREAEKQVRQILGTDGEIPDYTAIH